jgi:hypothetical protein
MSSAFIRHLQKRGPISIKAAGNRYWRQQLLEPYTGSRPKAGGYLRGMARDRAVPWRGSPIRASAGTQQSYVPRLTASDRFLGRVRHNPDEADVAPKSKISQVPARLGAGTWAVTSEDAKKRIKARSATRFATDLRRDWQKAMARNAVDLSVRFVAQPEVYNCLTKGQGCTQAKRLLVD